LLSEGYPGAVQEGDGDRMNRLVSVIGPAPSEMSKEEFYDKLRTERQRVSGILAEWRAAHALKQAKKRKPRKPKAKSKAKTRAKSNPTPGKAEVCG